MILNEQTRKYFKAILGKVGKDNFSEITIDPSTHAQNVIDHEHHEVHSGSMYHASVSSADLGAETGDHIQISFTTPPGNVEFHMVPDAYGSGEVLFTIREAPTGGNVGTTALTAYNKNRSSIKTTSATTIYQATTVGTGGIVIANIYLGAGNNKVAGSNRAMSEWLLKAETTYTFRVYATAGNTAYLTLDWYEHMYKG